MTEQMHMSLDIRGFMNNAKYPDGYCHMFKSNDGNSLPPNQARDFLYDCLAKGWELIPYGDCDNFDYKHGCRGHQIDKGGNPVTPLFIPLKAEYFDAFVSGEKTEELRRYDKRWNEDKCFVGRHVVLSKGYGKKSRLYGKVTCFKKQRGTTFDGVHQEAIKDCFGTLDIDIACISIETRNEVYSAE